MKYQGYNILRKAVLIIGLFFVSFKAYPQDLTKQEPSAVNLTDPFKSKLPRELPKPIERPQEETIIPPAIAISGLIVGGPVPMAIIDGKLSKIGDKVQEATITNITKDGVEVLYKWKPFSYPAPMKIFMPIKGGKNDK